LDYWSSLLLLILLLFRTLRCTDWRDSVARTLQGTLHSDDDKVNRAAPASQARFCSHIVGSDCFPDVNDVENLSQNVYIIVAFSILHKSPSSRAAAADRADCCCCCYWQWTAAAIIRIFHIGARTMALSLNKNPVTHQSLTFNY